MSNLNVFLFKKESYKTYISADRLEVVWEKFEIEINFERMRYLQNDRTI